MKKTTLTIILTSILAFSVSFGQERPRLAKLIVAKAIKEKVSSGDIVRKDRPELSDEAKDQLGELKGKKEALRAELKENISKLGEGATKEEIKEATQAFKQANQDRFDEIKESHESIREDIKEARPHRQERPQLNMSDELKAKVVGLKEKRQEMKESLNINENQLSELYKLLHQYHSDDSRDADRNSLLNSIQGVLGGIEMIGLKEVTRAHETNQKMVQTV